MGAQDSAKRINRILNVPTVLLALAFLLPGLAPTLFGWISGLLAIPVFCLLCLYGVQKGTVHVRNGAILATTGAIMLHLLPGTLFSLTLVPLGFSFNRSAAANEDEIQTALKGLIVLGVSWFVFWTVYGTVQGINPYSQLLKVLDTGFAQTYEVYRDNTDIPLETLVNIERIVTELRAMIPKILPGVLMCTLLLTVWINLLGSISVLERLKPEALPWKKYSEWRLPDRLVWVSVIAGFAWALGEGVISNAGLCLILVSTLLYFFQGLAVLIYFVDRWKTPLYLKILIYGILILQSYGLIILSIAGLADVWIDFRRKHKKDAQPDN
ncbi:MAG: YybS family protein [Desulfobulbaceae bacterium]|nr:YybS family protein [Desulfobulbaceae bacterium]